MSLKKIVVAFLLFTLCSVQVLKAQNQNVTLTGQVTDFYTGKPIASATVYIDGLKKGTTTDREGKFELSVPKGRYLVSFSRAEMREEIRVIDLVNDLKFDVEMREAVFSLDEVAVYSTKQDANVTDLDVGKEQLDIEKLKSLPAFLGEPDVVKSLILLPGVSTVGEGASGFNVRGGGVDQNLIFQDGGIIFNPSHLFGFFSIFNPALVDQATLYKNAIPAKYGGRLSSILEVDLKQGDFKKFKGNGSFGVASSNVAVQGPIIKDKLSFNVGARASYLGFLFNMIDNPTVNNSSANFSDLNLKLSWLINDNNKLSLSSYLSNDGFSFASDTTFSWQTFNNSLIWNSILGERLAMDMVLANGNYNYEVVDESGFDAFELNSSIDYNRLFTDFVYDFNETISLNFGAEAIHYQFNPGTLEPFNFNSGIESEQVEREQSLETAIFAETEYNLLDNLSVRAGLRYSNFTTLGSGTDYLFEEGEPKRINNITDTISYGTNEVISNYGGLEPRLVLNYQINNRSSIKASYNRTRQYIHLITNTAAVTPIDNWKTSNKYIPPEVADQYSIGYFRNFNSNTYETSLEVYYKTATDIVDFKNGAVLLMNPAIETELINGTSTAYGAELFINKRAGLLTGWFGYTYSRSFRTVDNGNPEESINNGDQFPANYDKPHDLTFALNYKSSPLVEFGFNFTYSSGRPNTKPIALYSLGNLTNVYSYSDRNAERIPDYHRLDVSMTVKSKPKVDRNWRTSWTVGIYNLYGRKNAYSVYYANEFGTPPRAYKLSVLGSAFPSLSINFEFL